MDLAVSPALSGKLRRDWGLKNMIGVEGRQLFGGNDLISQHNSNAVNQQQVRRKIATFVTRAIYPQQLTVPRQYATTREGVWVYKILEGREIDGVRENGVRVVVQENAKQARFVISPLFGSKHDALSWAVKHMGATL